MRRRVLRRGENERERRLRVEMFGWFPLYGLDRRSRAKDANPRAGGRLAPRPLPTAVHAHCLVVGGEPFGGLTGGGVLQTAFEERETRLTGIRTGIRTSHAQGTVACGVHRRLLPLIFRSYYG